MADDQKYLDYNLQRYNVAYYQSTTYQVIWTWYKLLITYI